MVSVSFTAVSWNAELLREMYDMTETTDLTPIDVLGWPEVGAAWWDKPGEMHVQLHGSMLAEAGDGLKIVQKMMDHGWMVVQGEGRPGPRVIKFRKAAVPVPAKPRPIASVSPATITLRHPAPGATWRPWHLTETEAWALFTSLRGVLAPDDHFAQAYVVGAQREPEIIYMRTGPVEPEPTAAVKTWRRVIPIDGRPNTIVRLPSGRFMMIGDEGWARAHPISSGLSFTWVDLRAHMSLGRPDAWASTDE